jgi:hypothetical protein
MALFEELFEIPDIAVLYLKRPLASHKRGGSGEQFFAPGLFRR